MTKKNDVYLKKMIGHSIPLLLLRGVIGIAFALANVAVGQFSKQIYDSVILAGSLDMLWKLGAMYLLALFSFLLFYVLQEIVIIYIEERNAARLRRDTYAGYLKKPTLDMEKLRSGDLLTGLTSDIDKMKPLGGTVWLDIINGFVMLSVLLWWMFSVDGLLAVLLLPAPLVFCFAMAFFSTKMFSISEKLQKYRADTNSLISQIVCGSNTIRLFLLKPLIKQRFSKSISNIAEKSIELSVADAKMQSVWNLFIIPYQAIFFLIAGCIYIKKGTPTVGTILAFSNFVSFLIYPLMSLLGSVANLGTMFASKQRVWTILHGHADTKKKESEQSASGDIVLNEVCFAYKENEKVLQDVSFTIPGGKTTILWGRSGSGKSTLAKLLLGLYEPIKGTITITGQGNDVGVTTCSKKISLLEQHPFIFEGTIRENILLGRADADETQLRRAVSNACILKKIEQLPQGYDTVLDEKTPLSGGEKQRLALARTLIGDSDVFVLDEPTSALNSGLAHEVLNDLQNNYPETTKVIITHDASLLQYGDYCVVIDKGKVTVAGTMDNDEVRSQLHSETSIEH